MSTSVVLPKTGMGIEEGTVSRWLKREGEPVEQGEPLVEIETAKAVLTVESPSKGTLRRILIPEGETVAVNTEIAVID